jgi:hypothetical protein
MGEFDAAVAYDAARQLIDRPDEARALLRTKIDRDIELPSKWHLEDESDLRIWRAAYVLEQLPFDETRKLRERIRRPLPADGHNPFGKEAPENRVIDGERLISASGNVSVQRLNHQLCVCDPATGEPRKTLAIAGQPMKLTSDGRFLLLSMDNDSNLAAVELATATRLWRKRNELEARLAGAPQRRSALHDRRLASPRPDSNLGPAHRRKHRQLGHEGWSPHPPFGRWTLFGVVSQSRSDCLR